MMTSVPTIKPADLPAHSPLGASSAERWMNCPGSVELIKAANFKETEEPDYRMQGTAAHEAIAHCLREKLDAWEIVGETFNGVEVDVEMADAIQVYFDTVRPLMVPQATVLIETRIKSDLHPLFYGTVDCATIADSLLTVSDFKYGQGIAVDVEDNPQLKYYAFGILQDHPDVRRVVLRIIQPRGFHPSGEVVRRWECSAEDIVEWANKELIPAMERVEMDNSLDPGDWCRFCTAKLVCPALKGIFRAVVQADKDRIVPMSDEQLLADYPLLDKAQMYIKAFKAEAMRRLMENQLGLDNGVIKLVNKKANRVWKPEAEDVLRSRFGDKAYSTPELLSPAAMEKVDAAAKALAHEYAYTPQTGYTVALAGDKRPGVKAKSAVDAFAAALDSVTD